ncbi:HrgC protein [Fusobacterium sp. 1001295B_180824_G3]|uniref:HrgC protein n=1 Tax=Fusobacterium sp. 1001295B_180824_G3 TaxID=2787123 RepID=UPI00189BD323|nr:HrgC protein [Fusobacterium sp. 1001295B_180824_G3]
MAKVVMLEKNGVQKQGFVGFSWTMFFFGFFVPLFRGDFKWFIITLILMLLSFGLAQFIVCFLYNKFYTVDLLENGYRPADDFSENLLRMKGIII